MMMMSLVSAHEEHHLRCGTNEDEFVPNNPLDEHEDIRRALGTNPHPKRHVRHADSGAQAYQRFHRNLGTSTAIISVAFHAIRDFPCEDGNFCNCTNISLTEQDSVDHNRGMCCCRTCGNDDRCAFRVCFFQVIGCEEPCCTRFKNLIGFFFENDFFSFEKEKKCFVCDGERF